MLISASSFLSSARLLVVKNYFFLKLIVDLWLCQSWCITDQLLQTFNHLTKTPLKWLCKRNITTKWNNLTDDYTKSYQFYNSLNTVPKEQFQQNIRETFCSLDVLRLFKPIIFVVREVFSSLIITLLLTQEAGDGLIKGLIKNIYTIET